MKAKLFLFLALVAISVAFFLRSSTPLRKERFANGNSCQFAIVRFLKMDGVGLYYRENEALPFLAWVTRESHQLQLIAEIPTIEAVIISYSDINLDDFERLISLGGLKKLYIYGYPHNYEPLPGKEDRLLEVIRRMPNLETLSLGNASELFSLEAIVTTVQVLDLREFSMFNTSRSYVEAVKERIPTVYDDSLRFPFDEMEMSGKLD